MAVINATPDSFSRDGLYADQTRPKAIRATLEQTLTEGADILDIGAESTRPGSSPVEADVQMTRLKPVFDQLRQIARERPSGWCVSLDTADGRVARWGLAQGVQIVNDVRGGRDPELLAAVAEYDAEIVLMHNSSDLKRIEPHRLADSSGADQRDDIVEEVAVSLEQLVTRAMAAGIARGRIMVDPGIGFGKTVADNLRLIESLRRFESLGFPLLLGASRKSFLGRVLNLEADDRLEGSLAVHAAALLNGAHLIRVHDVAPHHRLRTMVAALRNPEKYE